MNWLSSRNLCRTAGAAYVVRHAQLVGDWYRLMARCQSMNWQKSAVALLLRWESFW